MVVDVRRGGVVTRPLWRIAGRLIGAVFGFVFKWLTLLKVCVRRYRRFVDGPSVQGRPSTERRWKTFEAIWATPMVVLEARGEHEDGLGRLMYKWLEAYHALWCVFLPDVLELSCKSTVKYWRGSRAECRRTVDHACCVWRGLWAFLSLSAYAVFYTVVYVRRAQPRRNGDAVELCGGDNWSRQSPTEELRSSVWRTVAGEDGRGQLR
uniref:Uncharacterized protein n=1 Tax=Phytophthora fragariae TaxID=53985 RepID=A0A6A3EZ59_9STRA|nr:hypothetical protein PF009_g12732 [Phytophthora fragariae]